MESSVENAVVVNENAVKPVRTKGILMSMSANAKQNVNGTEYRVASVAINGKTYLAKVWEKSAVNLEIGEECSVEIQPDGEKVWLTVLGSGDANVATIADFAHLFEMGE